MLKIVCDKEIPFLVEAVEQKWEGVSIFPMSSEKINASSICDADILVVRTRTKIDSHLLAGSNIKLVCTATIGYDHIDLDYCDQAGVEWQSCPGCNAQAVCDYIEESISEIEHHLSLLSPLSGPLTLGVVGVGHVGSLVVQMAEGRGMHVLMNDPPKGIGVSLDEIADKCDIITFHTPLDKDTFHLCDASFLSTCKPQAFIINAARGGIVDEQALLFSSRPFILDCWEGEPHINPRVLESSFRASMHIAGYSLQGKINATQMCLDGISQKFQLPTIRLSQLCAEHQLPLGDSQPGWLSRISEELKAHPAEFEKLRRTYPLR